MPRQRRRWGRWWIAAASIAWLAILGTSWQMLLDHAYQSAAPAQGLERWPPETRLPWAASHFRIVLFAHPFCPCTRATLHELNESLSRLPHDVSISIVFVTAGLSPDDVAESPIVSLARAMPRVEVSFDDRGAEARCFGAKTSGEAFAFDRQARLVFQGGLTPARGHHGDAAGQHWLEELAQGRSAAGSVAPVFGCHLPESLDDVPPPAARNP